MSEQILTQTTPGDGFNTEFIATYEQHNRQRNSVLRLLLHTAVGGIPRKKAPQGALFCEDLLNYVADEDGTLLQVE